MLGKGEYGTTDRKYLEFIQEYEPEYFALRDYPCEPDVLEKNGRTVRDHLEATTERHRNLLGLLPEYQIKGQPVSVVQGWKLDDYLEHLKMLKQNDLLTDYVAIGSVCRRNQDTEIRKIVNEIHGKIGDRKLHAFGVKANILRFKEMRQKLDSADSMAYEKKTEYNDRISNKGKTFRDSALAYLQFKDQINNYIQRGKSETEIQQTLA